MEYVAIISIIVCILIIFIEFLWLYALAEKQDRYNKKRKEDVKKIVNQIEAVLTASSQQGKDIEIEELKNFVKDNRDRLDDLTAILFKIIINTEMNSDEQIAVIKIYNKLAPLEFYKELLKNGNVYDKSVACQKAGMFFNEEQIPEIRKNLSSKNKELVYNAAMSLSKLGDEEIFAQYIIDCTENHEYSHRLIIEFIENYSGDLQKLCEKIFAKCDEYIKTSVIKGIAKYKFADFEKMYFEGINSKNQELAAASIKALGTLGNLLYEHDIITATNNKNWVIRSAAVKALANYSSKEVLDALNKAVTDSEWWVRYNAAKTLIKIDKGLSSTERILKGYDKYASDAIKYALYRGTKEE